MTNNDVFKKVKVALGKLADMRDAELKECFRLSGVEVSVAQFDSYKVGTENRRYKPMPDEALEAFLNGLIEYSRQ